MTEIFAYTAIQFSICCPSVKVILLICNFQVFLIGLIVSCCKGKKSVIEGEVDEDDSDMSDDELSAYYC